MREELEELVKVWRKAAKWERGLVRQYATKSNNAMMQYHQTKADLYSRHARDIAKILRKAAKG